MELLKGDFCLREVLMNSGRGQREPALQQTTWRRYSFLWWIRIIRQRGQSYENIYNRTSERKKGVIPVMPAVGVLGALYAFVNFIVRKDTLLTLPIPPMDVLLTQLYGMIMVLNMFGIVVVACMVYSMEFRGNAVKKMYMLPISVPGMYLCKFLILSAMLFIAVVLQNLALVQIGMTDLPQGAFEMRALIEFAGYSFVTSMPVLSFMVLVSSRFENMWMPLGIGVAGFLSGMALANTDLKLLLIHPFIIMFRPAVAMSARLDITTVMAAVMESLVFLGMGLWMAKNLRYE